MPLYSPDLLLSTLESVLSKDKKELIGKNTTMSSFDYVLDDKFILAPVDVALLYSLNENKYTYSDKKNTGCQLKVCREDIT